MIAEFEDPYILIHEKKLSSLQPLLPLLEQVVQSGRPPSSKGTRFSAIAARRCSRI